METQSRKYEVVPLNDGLLRWFVEIAAVNMLEEELNRPELVCLPVLYEKAHQGLDAGTAFVVTDNGVPCGAIGGLVVENLFNPSYRTLAEIFWYVLPSHRNTRAGALLLKAFESRAKQVADEMTLSILPQSDINIETLERRGFAFEELGFRKKF